MSESVRVGRIQLQIRATKIVALQFNSIQIRSVQFKSSQAIGHSMNRERQRNESSMQSRQHQISVNSVERFSNVLFHLLDGTL